MPSEENPSLEGKKMKRMRWLKKWIALGVGILFLGCATAEDVRILDSENRRLHSQLNVIQKDIEPLQKGMDGYRKEVANEITALQKEDIMLRADLSAELKKVQADLSAEIKKVQADFLLRFESLQSDMRNVSTGVEEYKDFIKKPPQELSRDLDRLRENIALRTKNLEEKERALEEKDRALEERVRAAEERFKGVEDRLRGTEERSRAIEERFKGLDGKVDLVGSKQADLEKRVTVREAKEKELPSPAPPPPPAEVKQPPPPLMGSADLYKDAYDTFERGDIVGARKKFENFLKQYPNAERSNNAQFWLGETYYKQKDYEKAIIEYENVINRYPEGEKVPDALYKQALAFLELKDRNTARNLLKRVIEHYPASKQAEEAKKKLKGLK